MATRNMDVLIIGAGQAGLALGYHLRATGLRFLIVDRHPRIGDSWRNRYDSLTLFTPRAYSALPGLSVSGDPNGYPTKDEIADYLEQYADRFGLPVALETGIRSLTRVDSGFRARTDAGEIIDARTVVVATGAYQAPAIPPIAQELAADVAQLTPESYKRPGQVLPGTALVVGDGATGRQIALELAQSGSDGVYLARGRNRRVSPARLLGRSVFWWMDRLGALRASRETRIGRYLMKTDPFPGKHLSLRRLQRRGIHVVGRVVRAQGNHITFAGGEATEIATVIWATGYRDDTRWVAIPQAKDAQGGFSQEGGLSSAPGLYFIGRSWQWTRGSALLAGVGDDALYVRERIREYLDGRRDVQTASEVSNGAGNVVVS
jgi:putative flavoprotein involved in K+ transport